MACPPPAFSLGNCLLPESPSKMASRSFISALTLTPGLLAAFWGSTTRAGCPWGSAFPRCQKVPGSLFEPPFLLSILPDLGGRCAGRNPRRPCARSTRSHGASRTQAVLSGSTPSPHPPLQFPQHSFRHYPTPPGPAAAPGAGSALWGGTPPTSLHTPPRAVPYPSGVTMGRDVLFLPLWGVEDGVGSPRVPHNSLYICINKWDFNGAPRPHVVITV